MTETIRPEWWFYHLTRAKPETAAPPLVQKCLDAGWRVLAVSPNAKTRAALDAALWTFDAGSFIPHGEAEAPGLDPARQPVLIAPKAENRNNASALMLIDGVAQPVDSPFLRCMVLFEDGDTPVREAARIQFKAAKDAGLVTRYFQQTPSGGWKEAGV